MESGKNKIILLSDFIDQRVRKTQELAYYEKTKKELETKMFFLRKEIELTNVIIDIIEKEKVINVREYLEDKSDNDT
tara:strand:+ start:514 stop:744 length:231 start_codon:yes stop_codon:yes gene_type:complete